MKVSSARYSQEIKCRYMHIARSNFERNGHKFDLSRLRDVIGHVSTRFPIGHFLLIVLWNQASL